MLLYLLRHGSTDYNDLGLVQGQLDIPLNDRGRSQIARVANHCKLVPFSKIYTSDLARAKEVSSIIAQHKPSKRQVVVHEGLRDRCYGSLEGGEWDEALGVPEDAESQESLTARLQFWLSTLIDTHTPSSTPASTPPSNQGPNAINPDIALVVTHEECLLTLLTILTEPSSPVPVRVAEGVDVGVSIPNASFAIVRVWWEKGECDALEPRGRLEAWAVGELLQED